MSAAELAALRQRVRALEAFLQRIVDDGQYEHWEFCRWAVDGAKQLLNQQKEG